MRIENRLSKKCQEKDFSYSLISRANSCDPCENMSHLRAAMLSHIISLHVVHHVNPLVMGTFAVGFLEHKSNLNLWRILSTVII